jgi:histidine ammonia-lyase
MSNTLDEAASASRLHRYSIDRLLELGNREPLFSLSDSEWERVRSAARAVAEAVTEGGTVYGVHTHHGHNVKTEADPADYAGHQRRLLDYLHVGVGPRLGQDTVRRALRLQCLKLAEGRSGVSPPVVEAVVQLSNGACDHPVPSLGSLGASGDLIPMAHAVAPALRRTGIHGPRDVIALVNTNAMMSSCAVEQFVRLRSLLDAAHEMTALTAVALVTPTEHFSKELFADPRRGSARGSGEEICSRRGAILAAHGATEPEAFPSLQERYSVRCAPMILGNARDLLSFAERKILDDALSVADNPVITRTGGKPNFLHGGLFYAASLASAADAMNDVVQTTADLMDRQVLLLMDAEWSHGLPDNLAISAEDHVKGIHQLVSALLQRIKTQRSRSHELSFSAEQHNQDVLPAAMTAQLQLSAALDVAEELVRAAHFVARRAVLLRLGKEVPPELQLAAWGG